MYTQPLVYLHNGISDLPICRAVLRFFIEWKMKIALELHTHTQNKKNTAATFFDTKVFVQLQLCLYNVGTFVVNYLEWNFCAILFVG